MCAPTARKINIGKFVHRKTNVLLVTDVAVSGGMREGRMNTSSSIFIFLLLFFLLLLLPLSSYTSSSFFCSSSSSSSSSSSYSSSSPFTSSSISSPFFSSSSSSRPGVLTYLCWTTSSTITSLHNQSSLYIEWVGHIVVM